MATYVIFKQGSKQYRAKEGDLIDIDFVEAESGSKIEFTEILFVSDEKNPLVGLPSVNDYRVECEVIGRSSGPKITSIKYKPSHNQVKKFGHRQPYTRVKIVGISKTEKSKHK